MFYGNTVWKPLLSTICSFQYLPVLIYKIAVAWFKLNIYLSVRFSRECSSLQKWTSCADTYSMWISFPSGFIKIIQHRWFSDEVNVPRSRHEGSPWITAPFWAGFPTAVPFSVSRGEELSLSALFPIKNSAIQKSIRKGRIWDQLAILSQRLLSTLPRTTTDHRLPTRGWNSSFGHNEAWAGVCVPLMWIAMRLSIILELSMALLHLIKKGN